MPKISLNDLQDRLDDFFGNRLVTGASEPARERLMKLDADLVAWFKERGVELIVDRDPVTHEQIG